MFDEARQAAKRPPHRSETPSTYLSLKDSEAAVLQAASRIYAATGAAGHQDEAQRTQAMRQAVHDAVRMAQYIDAILTSEGEI